LKALSVGYRETPYRMKLEVTDPENDNLTIKVKNQPKQGTCHIDGTEFLYLPDPGFTGMENIEIEVSDGELSSQTVLRLPIQEHANSIGISVDLSKAGNKEQAFVNMVYQVNEELKMTADHILRMDQEKTSSNFKGTISDKLEGLNIMTLDEWKMKLPEMKKETSFSFCPIMENGTIIWKIQSSLDSTSGANTDLDNNNTYVHNPINNESDSQKDNSLDPVSSVDTELNNESENTKNSNNGNINNNAPNKLAVSDLSNVEKIESAPNWYSLPGLGSFFDAGNGWLYQPEMGWCYAKPCHDGCSLWIYNQNTGWMWLKNDLPNVAYTMMGQLGQGWMYYPSESIGKSEVVFNYANKVWIRLN